MPSNGGLWVTGIVVACGCALAVYAAMTPASALMMEEAKDMRRAVLKRVPVGSTAAAAEAALAAEGFSCTQLLNKPFSTTDPDSGAVITHAPADVLMCDSGPRGFLITKRWQVMFLDPRRLGLERPGQRRCGWPLAFCPGRVGGLSSASSELADGGIDPR